MKVGTKSLLWGVHQIVLHPATVALAWWRLYGFPWDPRLWLCFLVHDWGYWGQASMNGPEDSHVELGARMCGFLLGREWDAMCRYHSRYEAKKDGMLPSELCFADKLSVMFVPWWVYVVLGTASGEIHEYLRLWEEKKALGEPVNEHDETLRGWFLAYREYVTKWVYAHVSGEEDSWTR